MKLTVLIVQIILSIVLIGLILLQAKGVGFGRSLGSQTYHSRRGMEILVFRFTVIVSILFVFTGILSQFVVA